MAADAIRPIAGAGDKFKPYGTLDARAKHVKYVNRTIEGRIATAALDKSKKSAGIIDEPQRVAVRKKRKKMEGKEN